MFNAGEQGESYSCERHPRTWNGTGELTKLFGNRSIPFVPKESSMYSWSRILFLELHNWGLTHQPSTWFLFQTQRYYPKTCKYLSLTCVACWIKVVESEPSSLQFSSRINASSGFAKQNKPLWYSQEIWGSTFHQKGFRFQPNTHSPK